MVLHGREFEVGCQRRSCPCCGLVWLKDTNIRALAAAQQLQGPVALVSITAPGRDVLPWDASGRRVVASAARSWNRTAPARWRKLYDAARRRALRSCPTAPGEWALVMKVWEYQKRGVLHLHLLVPMGSRRAASHSTALVRALAALAPLYGFGYVDRGKLPDGGGRRSARRLEPIAAERAAAYVASYLGGAGIGKGGIFEVAQAQGVPGALVYIAQRLTAASGVTMRSLKVRRRIICRYPSAVESADAWYAACLVDAVDRRRPPFSPETRAALLQRALAERWGEIVNIETGEAREPSQAPAPPRLLVGDATVAERSRRGLIRLDSVLHRADDTPSRMAWSTVLVTAESTSGGDEHI